jgi:hypothetical protein
MVRIDLLVDQIQPLCTLVGQIQPACTFVDQQDTIFLAQDEDYVQYFRATVHFGGSARYSALFLAQDARPRPVLQSRNPESDCHYYYTSVLFCHYVPSAANLRFHCRPQECP